MVKFRARIKEEKCFADYIETIRFYAEEAKDFMENSAEIIGNILEDGDLIDSKKTSEN
jgi:hypothetical protein|nr:MAG TPA: YopX protein [Caudoviricetes sp.]